ncbi:MAG: homoserine O-acetyltransferase [Odoribacteraceae bacterium]|jgi:homoserine O-acetyltransferase|nr:homoserine O-acetyltransferase [Odoribacteraceae bacterium]
MEVQYYHHHDEFLLEGGGRLPGLTVAYHTYGEMDPGGGNVAWVCHALTANSDVREWWPGTVEAGRFLDPSRYFVVCANILGSHYGTTGPLSANPETGRPWYGSFPGVTVRDMARCHKLLADHLGVKRVELLVGSSIGGFQCLELAVMYPGFARRVALIATAARAYPWTIALNESQRMAIELDPTFGEERADAGGAGMAVARSIALLSYRGQQAYDKTQDEAGREARLEGFRAASYQRYQGEKLRRRFNAYSYHLLTRAIDSHDASRGRGSMEEALGGIEARCLIVCISSDILFPASAHEVFRRCIPGARYAAIDSDFAHDGFLIEHEKLNNIILNFLRDE